MNTLNFRTKSTLTGDEKLTIDSGQLTMKNPSFALDDIIHRAKAKLFAGSRERFAKLSILNSQFSIIAVALMMAFTFTACTDDDPDPDADAGDVDGINMSDKDYYGDNQNALRIKLRNVRLKWVVKDGMIDNATGELSPDEYGEAMICKGRQWSKGHYNDYRDDPVLREQWYAYDADGILRGYNFIKHEKYAVDWYTTPPAPFGISTGSYSYAPQWIMLAQYYEADSKDDFWDAPYTEYAGGYKISTTTVTKVDKAATIAGQLCNMYTVTTTLFLANGSSTDFIVRKAWYDPETNVTMRVEEYDSVYGLRYTAEITEIEYGKVTVAQLDKILDDYLKTHNPTDVSDDENPGWDW